MHKIIIYLQGIVHQGTVHPKYFIFTPETDIESLVGPPSLAPPRLPQINIRQFSAYLSYLYCASRQRRETGEQAHPCPSHVASYSYLGHHQFPIRATVAMWTIKEISFCVEDIIAYIHTKVVNLLFDSYSVRRACYCIRGVRLGFYVRLQRETCQRHAWPNRAYATKGKASLYCSDFVICA